jgi:hypothetical protein
MRIEVGSIFKSNNPELPLQGVYRVLQILPDEIDELVVLIQVPTEARKGEGAKQRTVIQPPVASSLCVSLVLFCTKQ